jgi:hypothetical protein
MWEAELKYSKAHIKNLGLKWLYSVMYNYTWHKKVISQQNENGSTMWDAQFKCSKAHIKIGDWNDFILSCTILPDTKKLSLSKTKLVQQCEKLNLKTAKHILIICSEITLFCQVQLYLTQKSYPSAKRNWINNVRCWIKMQQITF